MELRKGFRSLPQNFILDCITVTRVDTTVYSEWFDYFKIETTKELFQHICPNITITSFECFLKNLNSAIAKVSIISGLLQKKGK